MMPKRNRNWSRGSGADFGSVEQRERDVTRRKVKALTAYLCDRKPKKAKRVHKLANAVGGKKGADRAMHLTYRQALAKEKPLRSEYFPAYVTDGMRVRVFMSREEADAAGFPWVGQ